MASEPMILFDKHAVWRTNKQGVATFRPVATSKRHMIKLKTSSIESITRQEYLRRLIEEAKRTPEAYVCEGCHSIHKLNPRHDIGLIQMPYTRPYHTRCPLEVDREDKMTWRDRFQTARPDLEMKPTAEIYQLPRQWGLDYKLVQLALKDARLDASSAAGIATTTKSRKKQQWHQRQQRDRIRGGFLHKVLHPPFFASETGSSVHHGIDSRLDVRIVAPTAHTTPSPTREKGEPNQRQQRQPEPHFTIRTTDRIEVIRPRRQDQQREEQQQKYSYPISFSSSSSTAVASSPPPSSSSSSSPQAAARYRIPYLAICPHLHFPYLGLVADESWPRMLRRTREMVNWGDRRVNTGLLGAMMGALLVDGRVRGKGVVVKEGSCRCCLTDYDVTYYRRECGTKEKDRDMREGQEGEERETDWEEWVEVRTWKDLGVEGQSFEAAEWRSHILRLRGPEQDRNGPDRLDNGIAREGENSEGSAKRLFEFGELVRYE